MHMAASVVIGSIPLMPIGAFTQALLGLVDVETWAELPPELLSARIEKTFIEQ